MTAHETMLARHIIGGLQRRMPGLKAKIALSHYDTRVHIWLGLGRRRHALNIKPGARRELLPSELNKIAAKLRRARIYKYG